MALGLRKLARFCATALGWQVVNRGGYGVLIGTGDGSSEIDLRSVPDGPKPVKNRPAKSRPVSRDRAVELDGLLALGARSRMWELAAAAPGMAFKLIKSAQRRWRMVDAPAPGRPRPRRGTIRARQTDRTPARRHPRPGWLTQDHPPARRQGKVQVPV